MQNLKEALEQDSQPDLDGRKLIEQNDPPLDNQEHTRAVRGLAVVRTRVLVGVQALPVMVEVHLANGLPCFTTVGLAETAVRESKERVRGAILNSGFEFPAKRITVNLAPADLPKSGGHFDLAIALGILLASGQLVNADVDELEIIGELALDGRLRQVAGVLPVAMACGEANRSLVLPSDNAQEAGLLEDTCCWHAAHLLDVCYHLVGKQQMSQCQYSQPDQTQTQGFADMADVKGQPQAKRALEVAASGGHSVLLIGPPGTGKSMLAARLAGILPPLKQHQALETAAVHSISRNTLKQYQWRQRPFRSPHHSSSSVALVGGGSHPRPGEISLAHNGILFLDELAEFGRATLEQLREPLETGQIHIARANQSVTYPACFQLITACNPCPCGFLGDGTERCQCSVNKIDKYLAKLSGPLLDRIDIQLRLPRVSPKQLRQNLKEETSSNVRNRVEKAQAQQFDRQGQLNHQLKSTEIEQVCNLSTASYEFLDAVSERLHLSARAYHRIMRVARTIADIEAKRKVEQQHLAEAVGYRSLDRLIT